MLMQITLTKEQIKEVFGELRYMGADYCYRYDKDTSKENRRYRKRSNFILEV